MARYSTYYDLDGEIDSMIDEQHRTLLSFQALESDHDLAYRLQLEEALAASLSTNDASSVVVPSPRNRPPSPVTVRVSNSINDKGPSSSSASSRNDDNNKVYPVRIRLAPIAVHNEGSSSSRNVNDKASPVRVRVLSEDVVYRVYCKGVAGEEWDSREGKLKNVLGIGVAICDGQDNLISEVKERMVGVEKNRVISEFRALIAGLSAASDLSLNQVRFFCDYHPLFQYVTGRWQPKQRKIESLVKHLNVLRRKFKNCFPALVARNDLKFAFKIARDALNSEVPMPSGASTSSNMLHMNISSNENLQQKEKCVICLEDTDAAQMFSVDACHHRYCFSCMRQHIEVKLRYGIEPKCPHEDCKSNLTLSSCSKILTPNLIGLMKQRMKEASIPPPERIYCPYPRCSALMSKTEVAEYAKSAFCGDQRSGARKCLKCHGIFCINCKVPWHSNMTCFGYKMSQTNSPAEDVKLKSLATRNMWRQCVKCSHMIELAQGCYHMTCRCGYEFCYNCGAEWKDKKATCSCPLWDEGHLLDDSIIDYDDEFDEEKEDYSDDDYHYDLDSNIYFMS